MREYDSWELINDALECKTPAKVPSICIGADWSFMERLYHSPYAFTYEEFKDIKKKGIGWIPTYIPASIKLGVNLTWSTSSLGKFIWLDETSEPGSLTFGTQKMATRLTDFIPPEGVPKRPVPHIWHVKSCFKTNTPKEQIEQFIEKQPRIQNIAFRKYNKLSRKCEKYYNLVLAGGSNCMWEPLSLGIGISLVTKLWRKDKPFLYQLRDFFHEMYVTHMERLIKYGKPKVVMVGDDYGFNAGLLMDIKLWREIVKPTLAQQVQIAHDADVKYVLHSCGKIESLFGDFVEIGIDGVESLKPKNNDLVALKKKYGDKIALLGTIDDSDMLKFSTPDQIRPSVIQSIKDLGPGGYIPGATNFLLDQPVENIVAMYDTIKEYKI